MFREKLTWILDKFDVPKGIKDDDLYQQNIDFVHSLGLKCDCVGWCEITLDNPKTDEILNQIEQFCRANGWKARGWYEVTYENDDCEWYELVGTCFKDKTVSDRIEIPCENGKTDRIPNIHAYRETSVSPKEEWRSVYVPTRFVNAYKKMAESAAKFCWLKDVGKYTAEQYFAVYPSESIAHIGVDWKLRKTGIFKSEISSWKYESGDKKIINEMGGWLPRLTNLFYELNIHLPDCYLSADMPKGDMAIAYYDESREVFSTRKTVLLHKRLAKKLLDAKAISEKHIRPAMLVEDFPAGYMCITSTAAPQPTDDFLSKNQSEYNAFLQNPRPIRQVSEKDALKQMRNAKRERKDDFGKALPKAKATELVGAEYEALIPYYQIANGGYLSDEYELLDYASSLTATDEFILDMQKEELIADKPKGIVMAKCADGDKVLLCNDGTVIRFSHEEPTETEKWSSLPQFVFEATSEV